MNLLGTFGAVGSISDGRTVCVETINFYLPGQTNIEQSNNYRLCCVYAEGNKNHTSSNLHLTLVGMSSIAFNGL